ncbi:MAG TPA: Sir2 family NAD-dependent protein deacetylase [Mycobacteriales bacterium]|nr:Sir2 family NAD-dependent protein deacetylase [Mycobacteriales bacterium]
MVDAADEIVRVAGWLGADGGVTTVLTGAGISTDSGIPDFRGPTGVWTTDPAAQRMVDISVYAADPEIRRAAWRRRRDHPTWSATPNAAHRALVDLERAGRLRAIVTQNIDRLHQRAGSAGDQVIELHGSMAQTVCLSCRDRRDMAEALARLDAGEADPPCLACGGILKSATIFFGESLDRQVLAAAQLAAAECAVFLVIGTSLTVAPASWLPGLAAEAGARVVIVNGAPTPYDRLADAVIRQPIGAAVPALVARAVAS